MCCMRRLRGLDKQFRQKFKLAVTFLGQILDLQSV